MTPAPAGDCQFNSGGEVCAGKLYLPATGEPAPVVVMGHGLGALQEFGLTSFADTFVTEQANFLVEHLRPEPAHDD